MKQRAICDSIFASFDGLSFLARWVGAAMMFGAADDYGRFLWAPLAIKGIACPFGGPTDEEISQAMVEVEQHMGGDLLRYNGDGESDPNGRFGVFLGWFDRRGQHGIRYASDTSIPPPKSAKPSKIGRLKNYLARCEEIHQRTCRKRGNTTQGKQQVKPGFQEVSRKFPGSSRKLPNRTELNRTELNRTELLPPNPRTAAAAVSKPRPEPGPEGGGSDPAAVGQSRAAEQPVDQPDPKADLGADVPFEAAGDPGDDVPFGDDPEPAAEPETEPPGPALTEAQENFAAAWLDANPTVKTKLAREWPERLDVLLWVALWVSWRQKHPGDGSRVNNPTGYGLAAGRRALKSGVWDLPDGWPPAPATAPPDTGPGYTVTPPASAEEIEAGKQVLENILASRGVRPAGGFTPLADAVGQAPPRRPERRGGRQVTAAELAAWEREHAADLAAGKDGE